MDFLYVKALHIIFVVTWFSGLFYIPRLFIYQTEAENKLEPAKSILQTQFKLMSKRLWYIITWPSAILAVLFAVILLVMVPSWLSQSWMWIKLVFVVLLIVYHLKTHQIFKQLQRDEIRYSSNFMRLWNEGATLILFSVVFLVVLKSNFHWIFGVLGLFGLAFLLLLGIRLYKKTRKE